MTLESFLLAAVVFLAFTVEASVGFGSTVVTVALASLWMPLDDVLPIFVPVTLPMSFYLVLRYRQYVAWRFLSLRVVPYMAVGLPLGVLSFAYFAGNGLKLGLGAFIVVLSAVELRRLGGGVVAPQSVLPPAIERLALIGGGLAHGAFGSGGPLAVWVSGRMLVDKSAFRASLSLLWFVLNVALIVNYAFHGRITAASMYASALLVPSLVLGLVLGEWMHARIPLRLFRMGVFLMLLVVGGLLVTGV